MRLAFIFNANGNVLGVGILTLVFLVGCREDQKYLEAGNKQYQNGNYDMAIKYYDVALAKDSFNTLAYLGRANAWAEKGGYNKALSDYDKAIAIDPAFTFGYYGRGLVYSEMGLLTNALADYTKAIELMPEYVDAYINRADLFLTMQDTSRALSDYDVVLELSPRDANALLARGYIMLSLEKYDQCIKDYSVAISIDPHNPASYLIRAEAWYVQKKYKQALADCSKAVQLSPLDFVANNNLAWIYATCPDDQYRNGELAVALAGKALNAARELLTKDQISAAYDTLAAAYAECRNFQLAVKYIEEAVRNCGGDLHGCANYEEHMRLYFNEKPLRSYILGR